MAKLPQELFNTRQYALEYLVWHAMEEVTTAGLKKLATPCPDEFVKHPGFTGDLPQQLLGFWNGQPLDVALRLLGTTSISVSLTSEETERLTDVTVSFVRWVQEHFFVADIRFTQDYEYGDDPNIETVPDTLTFSLSADLYDAKGNSVVSTDTTYEMETSTLDDSYWETEFEMIIKDTGAAPLWCRGSNDRAIAICYMDRF